MPEPSANIRVASAGDADAILAIYAPNVSDEFVSFELEVPTPEEMRGRIVATLATHPWLVWEVGGRVAGYAYASKHRERLAYQWSADVSCYVDRAARGRGVGKALYHRAAERGERAPARVGGIRAHRRLSRRRIQARRMA